MTKIGQTTNQMCIAIRGENMNIQKSGTLRFWGDWFGRPYDNYHTVIAAYKTENLLVLHFDQGEKCTIYEPKAIVNEKEQFHIAQATKIIWEWYAYGKPHTSQYLCKRCYTRENTGTIFIEYFGILERKTKQIDPQKHYALELL